VHQLRVYLDINTTTSREAGSFIGQLSSSDSTLSSIRTGSDCGGSTRALDTPHLRLLR
jgi:hypothetical protein